MNSVVLKEAAAEASPRLTARTAGVFYFLNTLAILLAIFCFRGLIAPRDPAATATNLLAHESLFRLGSALELISTACSIVVAALLYELLKPVNATISLLAAFFRLVACAVAVFGYVLQLAPLQVLGGAQSLSGLNLQELPAIALLLYRLHGPASDIVIVFFGFHFVLVGYLIFRSTFLPRPLGVLAGLGGLGGLTFLAPPLANYLYRYILATGALAEVSLTVWLLAIGVNVQRWKERAVAAGG